MLYRIILVIFLASQISLSQDIRYEINIPDIPGYKTLKCDFHMHTVFSDGLVWPTTRVTEAWREGLDAIAITDHLEHHPHREKVSIDMNSSYQLAIDMAAFKDIILINGVEVTLPTQHYNDIFLKDANILPKNDIEGAAKEAISQGGFVFWNHHAWKGVDNGMWTELQTKMQKDHLLGGIEVANGVEDAYYPEAFRCALEKNLTIFGNSDQHDPFVIRRTSASEHRTMTFVFAKDKSSNSIREAVFAGKTAVWYKDKVIGREEYLRPLADACLQISDVYSFKYTMEPTIAFAMEITNKSDIDITMMHTGGIGPATIYIPANATIVVDLTSWHNKKTTYANYEIKNFLINPDKQLPYTLKIKYPGE